MVTFFLRPSPFSGWFVFSGCVKSRGHGTHTGGFCARSVARMSRGTLSPQTAARQAQRNEQAFRQVTLLANSSFDAYGSEVARPHSKVMCLRSWYVRSLLWDFGGSEPRVERTGFDSILLWNDKTMLDVFLGSSLFRRPHWHLVCGWWTCRVRSVQVIRPTRTITQCVALPVTPKVSKVDFVVTEIHCSVGALELVTLACRLSHLLRFPGNGHVEFLSS